jgi:hypothetical protein
MEYCGPSCEYRGNQAEQESGNGRAQQDSRDGPHEEQHGKEKGCAEDHTISPNVH